MFNIRVEMSDIDSIVMIATVADSAADFEALKGALAGVTKTAAKSVAEKVAEPAKGIVSDWPARQPYTQPIVWPTTQQYTQPIAWLAVQEGAQPDEQSGADQPEQQGTCRSVPLSIPLLPDFRSHLHSSVTYTELSESAGMVAASMLTPYPPGIPLVCPGEKITPELCDSLKNMLQAGIKVIGICGGNKIAVYNNCRVL
jgi:hypothetical protein